MSIHFNMTNAQEFGQQGFIWDISKSKSDDSGGSDQKIDKKSDSRLAEIQIPTVKKIAKRRKKTKRNDKNHVEESSDHETHIWTERERRKKMKDMFTKLHALLPELPPKADKSTIVDEAVNSIKSLEQTLQKLHNKKLEKLHNSSSSNTTTPVTIAFVPSSSPSPTTLITPVPQIPYDQSYSPEAFLADQIPSASTISKNLPYPCNEPITAFDTWSSPNVVLNICGNEAFFNFCCPKDESGVLTAVCYLFEKHNIEVLVVNVSCNVYRRTYMIQAQVNEFLGDGIGVGEIFKQAAQELVLYVSSL